MKKVMVIDDVPENRDIFTTLLEDKYQVIEASSGREGLELAEKEIPDLIFLDLKLPDGDGMDILSEIKRITPDPLVIIISAYGSEERRQDAKKKGVHSFIDKPLTEEKILSTIKQFQK